MAQRKPYQGPPVSEETRRAAARRFAEAARAAADNPKDPLAQAFVTDVGKTICEQYDESWTTPSEPCDESDKSADS